MTVEQDTIVAVATARGRAGIGVVRVSGPTAASVLERVLRMRGRLEAGCARLAQVIDAAAGAVLDEAVVTYFAGPRSYTGEDVLEVSAHGAPVLLDYLVRAAVAGGARLAEPGEFTRRAFLAGRLDLTQAEAVEDLVAAQTIGQARVAAAQLGGSVSRSVTPVKEQLLDLIAALEAGIDFAEDDIDFLTEGEIGVRLNAIQAPLAGLARGFAYGGLVRDGLLLAIVGRPNAGKSSLFNRLLERERAIVTAEPGTTRDPVSERLAIAGVPVELVDTAGLRDAPGGEAEAEGIRRSRAALAEADLVLYVLEANAEAGEEEEEARRLPRNQSRELLMVVNKVDLVPELARRDGWSYVSARTGEGIEGLRERLEERVRGEAEEDRDLPLMTNLRQQHAVTRALNAARRAESALRTGTPHEFLLLDLNEALASLDELTGATQEDEVLRRIFAGFCIGK